MSEAEEQMLNPNGVRNERLRKGEREEQESSSCLYVVMYIVHTHPDLSSNFSTPAPGITRQQHADPSTIIPCYAAQSMCLALSLSHCVSLSHYLTVSKHANY